MMRTTEMASRGMDVKAGTGVQAISRLCFASLGCSNDDIPLAKYSVG
jgi:hypothetical protein